MNYYVIYEDLTSDDPYNMIEVGVFSSMENAQILLKRINKTYLYRLLAVVEGEDITEKALLQSR